MPFVPMPNSTQKKGAKAETLCQQKPSSSPASFQTKHSLFYGTWASSHFGSQTPSFPDRRCYSASTLRTPCFAWSRNESMMNSSTRRHNSKLSPTWLWDTTTWTFQHLHDEALFLPIRLASSPKPQQTLLLRCC